MAEMSPPIPRRGPIEVQSDLVTPLPSSGAGRGEKGVRPGKGGLEARAALRVTQPRIQTLGRFKFSPQALCFTLPFFLGGGRRWGRGSERIGNGGPQQPGPGVTHWPKLGEPKEPPK